MSPGSSAVLLLAHGSPERAEDVPAFMQNVTSGRAVPLEVIEEVERRYRLIGRSPLRDITEKQARALQHKLDIQVYVGMRNWEPYIPEVIRQMIAEGINRAAVICLAPQNSRTSVGQYRRAVFAASEEKIKLEFVK